MSYASGKTALAYARVWHHVDAQDKTLGRLASKIAIALMGKYKPVYHQSIDCGDYVVVTNAALVGVSGSKRTDKVYKSHSGYPGGQKIVPFDRFMKKHPCGALRKAVARMLPKNNLQKPRLQRLLIFEDNEHPYEQNILKKYDEALWNGEAEQNTLGERIRNEAQADLKV